MTEVASIIQPVEGENFAVHQLNNFVTQIWVHPLVTEKLNDERANARQYLAKYNSLDGVLLIPVGGQIWRATKDMDYLLITDSKTPGFVNDLVANDLNETYNNKSFNRPCIHIAGLTTVGDKLYSVTPGHEEYIKKNRYKYKNIGEYQKALKNDLYDMSALFLTPDEYISGDHFYLKELRRRAVSFEDYIINGRNVESNSELAKNQLLVSINDRLRKIKAWPVKGFTSPEGSKYPDYIQLLLQRSRQTHNPEKYMMAFYNSLINLQVPNLNIIKTAIEITEGEIHLNQKSKTQGIY